MQIAQDSLYRLLRQWLWLLISAVLLPACGGGGDDTAPAPVLPIIITAPTATSVPEGSTATFSVAVTGTGISYQWRKGGVDIAGASGSSFTTPANALSNQGDQFSVVVSNTAGSVTSASAVLSVTAIAPTLLRQPAAVSVEAGQVATFEIEARGSAPLAIQWLRGGTAITGATSARYSTPATQIADGGAIFSATVTNAAGTVTSSPAELRVTAVIEAPAIVTAPRSLSVSIGQTASFSVTASGTEPLAYQWKKAGANVGGATAASYSLPAAALADSGSTWTVTVSNATGSVTSAAAVLTVTPARAGPLLPADYLVASSAGDFDGSSGRLFVAIVDPSNPTAPLAASQMIPADTAPWMPSSFVRNGAGERVVGPAPFAYFLRGGMVYRINLLRGAGTAPQRVSSITDACALAGAVPRQGDASEAILTVWTTALSGCGTDNRVFFVSSVASDSTQGTQLFTARMPDLPLYDATTNAIRGWLLWDSSGTPARLRVLSADLRTFEEVDNGAAVRVGQMRLVGGDSTDPQAVYLQIDDASSAQVRRFSWTDTGARLSDILYTFGTRSISNAGSWGTDASGTYFVDDFSGSLLRLRGAAPAQLVRNLFPDGTRDITGYILLTQDHVVVQVRNSLVAVTKVGDSSRRLATHDASLRLELISAGAFGDDVVYVTRTESLGLETLRRIPVTSGSPQTIATQVRHVANLPGLAWQRGALDPKATRFELPAFGPAAAARLEALLYCAPAAGSQTCRGAALYRHELSTGVTVKAINLGDTMTRVDAYQTKSDYIDSLDARNGVTYEMPLYAALPGTFYTLAAGAGTVLNGGFVPNGRWLDRYLLLEGSGGTARRMTLLTP